MLQKVTGYKCEKKTEQKSEYVDPSAFTLHHISKSFKLGKLDETRDAKQTEACLNLPSLRSLGRLKHNKQKPPLKVYNESKQGRPGYRFISAQLLPIRKAL